MDIPIRGDKDPNEFNWNMKLTNEEMMALYKRNPIIQLSLDWMTAEALRQKITFKIDQAIDAEKFGQPHVFDTYLEWFQWIGGWTKLREAIAWSGLYGIAIAVLWDTQKGIKDYRYKSSNLNTILTEGLYFPENKDPQAYSDFKVFYPMTNNLGYKVLDSDDDGIPVLIQLNIKIGNKKKDVKKVYVSGKRCVEFIAPRKEDLHEGTSRVHGLMLVALAQEQLLKASLDRAKSMAGGIKYFKTNLNKTDAAAYAQKLATLTYNDIAVLDKDSELGILTPDLKASTELSSLNEMMTHEFSRHTRAAQKLIDGESQGIQASAKYDMLSTYTPIYELQEHYTRPIEELFFHMGKKETTFTWNEIIPEAMDNPNDIIDFKGKNQVNENNAKNKENPSEKESDLVNSDNQNNKSI